MEFHRILREKMNFEKKNMLQNVIIYGKFKNINFAE